MSVYYFKIDMLNAMLCLPSSRHRTLRLEYYNTSTVSQKVMQGKWDCWATVSLSPRGEVDLQDICKALYVDLEYLTVGDHGPLIESTHS